MDYEHEHCSLRTGAAPWRVTAVKRSSRQLKPPPPYNTAALQLDASARLSPPAWGGVPIDEC